ncbi:MAG: hypothetical protein AB8F94_18155 [Saprospiraceae bacterium]
MKDQFNNIILDAPFVETDTMVRMSQDETIIWRGAPSRSLSIFDIGFDLRFILAIIKRGAFFSWFILAFLLHYIFLGLSPTSTVVWLTIGTLAIVTPEYLLTKRRMNTQYILTSKQLIFHLWWWGKKSTHTIPLSNIANVMISENSYGSIGTILILIKDASQLTFTTFDFVSNEIRHQPSLEMIKDIHTVTGIFQNAIRENRKK